MRRPGRPLARSIPGSQCNERPPRRPRRLRPHPHPGRAALHPDPGRPRRGGHQDRAPGGGRRHPQLRSPLPAPGRRRGQLGERLLRGDEPQQALRHPRPRPPGGAGDRAPAHRRKRRPGGELQDRRPREVRARLPRPQGRLPGAHLLLGDRLRPYRTLRGAARLRRPHPGDGRGDEHHRRAGRGADEGRRLHRRPHVRDVRGGRGPRRGPPPLPDRRGPARRRLDARRARRMAREPGHELPRDRGEPPPGSATSIRTSCPTR